MDRAEHAADRQRWTSRFNGLRGRMALLLLAVLLLPTGYAVLLSVEQYLGQSERQQRELERAARLIADQQARSLDSIQTWLESSARLEDFPVSGPACDEHLASKREEMRLVDEYFIVAPNGVIVCSATTEHNGARVDSAFWFQRAIRGSVFTVSELLSHVGGNETLIAAVPIYIGEAWRTEPWSPAGVLAASLDLEAFAFSDQTYPFDIEHEIYLIDRLGRRVPPMPWLADDQEPTGIQALLAGERASLEVEDQDEQRSLLATAAIGFSGLQVVTAMPVDRLEWLRPAVLVPILLPALILLAGVVAIFTGTHYVVNRHVEKLAEAVRRHRPGGGGLAAATSSAPNELKELGSRFVTLTEQLEERERSLRDAVAQKDLLLREVNHRVKNNLQVVASLLRMRARSERTPESRAAIRDAHARIEAIALVHRRIYEQRAVEQVELSSFMGELIEHLRQSVGHERVKIEAAGDLPRLPLATDRTVSMALLITELVTNAVEHAFPDGRRGRVEIHMERLDDGLMIAVADDGIGFDIEARHDGTGINLSELLARQLGGTLTLKEAEPGTRVELRIPADRLDETPTSGDQGLAAA